MPQGPPPSTPPVAFADESFREDPTAGRYVLAATVLAQEAWEPAREVMRRLLGSRRTDKLHWHEMDRLQQKDAAHRVAGIGGLHVVALGTPVPRRRQERARAACLRALVSWNCWANMCTYWRYPPAVKPPVHMRKARLPVCPRSPGLATHPTPTAPG